MVEMAPPGTETPTSLGSAEAHHTLESLPYRVLAAEYQRYFLMIKILPMLFRSCSIHNKAWPFRMPQCASHESFTTLAFILPAELLFR